VLLGAALEVVLLRRPSFIPWLAVPMFCRLPAANAVRWGGGGSFARSGDHWNVQVVIPAPRRGALATFSAYVRQSNYFGRILPRMLALSSPDTHGVDFDQLVLNEPVLTKSGVLRKPPPTFFTACSFANPTIAPHEPAAALLCPDSSDSRPPNVLVILLHGIPALFSRGHLRRPAGDRRTYPACTIGRNGLPDSSSLQPTTSRESRKKFAGRVNTGIPTKPFGQLPSAASYLFESCHRQGVLASDFFFE